MSILELPPPPQTVAAESTPGSDRLRVITAGRVGNMEARLGTSGFDVVAVAETEGALIDAVSTDEPDAILVEADLCASLEHVRDLAPDAVVIVIGDHTPPGALGRIERGVSGTVMAGLLHALVAEGVGGAVGWGFVPSFGSGAGLQVAERVSGWLLWAKADLLRAHLVNALRDHVELVTAAITVAVTVSASVVLTLGAPRRDERPASVPAPVAVSAPPHPVVATYPTTPTLADLPTRTAPADDPSKDGDRGNRGRRNHGRSRQDRRHGVSPSDASRPPGVADGWDRRPPKHPDDGNHIGWSDNSVPEDLPPGGNSAPEGHGPGSAGKTGKGQGSGSAGKTGKGQGSGPPCVPASPHC